jgi:hypothetical protein
MIGFVALPAQRLKVAQRVIAAVTKGQLVVALQQVGGITLRAGVAVAHERERTLLSILRTPRRLTALVGAEEVHVTNRLKLVTTLYAIPHLDNLPPNCYHYNCNNDTSQ